MLPSCVEKLISERVGGTLVQIGAHDGSLEADFFQLVAQRSGWKCILVEPVFHLFESLQLRHRGSDRVICVHGAISNETGNALFHHLPKDALTQSRSHLPWWYDQIGSLDLKHVSEHLDLEARTLIESSQVPCWRLPDLLQMYCVISPEILLIDAEGSDGDIIGQIEFDHTSPTLIVFEHKHLAAEERLRISRLLRSQNYSLLENEYDTVAMRNERAVSKDALGPR